MEGNEESKDDWMRTQHHLTVLEEDVESSNESSWDHRVEGSLSHVSSIRHFYVC